MMVRREDFIERLSKKGYTKQDASVIMDDFLAALQEALAEGESVMFRGFGTFEVRDRMGRESKDTKGNKIFIPPYRSVHFTVGKVLKKEIQENKSQE